MKFFIHGTKKFSEFLFFCVVITFDHIFLCGSRCIFIVVRIEGIPTDFYHEILTALFPVFDDRISGI